MTVETATQISQLNATLPLGSDPKSEGDNHLRLIKLVLQDVFNDATAGIMQLVLQHVKAGLLSSTKQGIEFDDSGDAVRARISTDLTNTLANGLIELYDSAHTLQRSVTLKPGKAGTPAVAGNDGELLHTGNAFYSLAVANNVDFPVGTVLLAYIASVTSVTRNSVVALALAATAQFEISGAGTAVTGTWVARGGLGISGNNQTLYLVQRIA